MTQFSGAMEVAGLKIPIELDRAPLERDLAALRADVARGMGVGSIRMGVSGGGGPTPAPTAAQVFSTSWQMGGATAGSGAGPVFQPGTGWTVGNTGTPAARRAASGGVAGGGGVGGLLGSTPNLTMGGHGGLLSLYGLASAGAAILDFTNATIEASRNMKVAVTNAQALSAMLQQRSVGESFLNSIPMAGPIALSGRKLFDTAMNRGTQEDIERNAREEDFLNNFYQGRSDAAGARSVLRARTRAAGYGPAMSVGAQLEYLQAQRRESERGIRSAYADKIKATRYDEPAPMSKEDYDAYKARQQNATRRGKQDRDADRAVSSYDEWQAKTNDARARINTLSSDMRKDLAASNEKYQTDQAVLKREQELQLQELKARQEIADQTVAQKFQQAEVTRLMTDYKQELARTTVEQREQFRKTAISEAKANIASMAAQIGRQEAEAVDYTRIVIGDPAGIRHLKDEMQSMNTYLQKLNEGDPKLLLGR